MLTRKLENKETNMYPIIQQQPDIQLKFRQSELHNQHKAQLLMSLNTKIYHQ